MSESESESERGEMCDVCIIGGEGFVSERRTSEKARKLFDGLLEIDSCLSWGGRVDLRILTCVSSICPIKSLNY